MQSGRFLRLALLASLLCSAHAEAADSREAAKMLAEAERLRATDKAQSRQLLDAAHPMLSPASDPVVRGQAQLLECRWADEPAVAYRAAAAGLALADQAKSAALRAKLLACRG